MRPAFLLSGLILLIPLSGCIFPDEPEYIATDQFQFELRVDSPEDESWDIWVPLPTDETVTDSGPAQIVMELVNSDSRVSIAEWNNSSYLKISSNSSAEILFESELLTQIGPWPYQPSFSPSGPFYTFESTPLIIHVNSSSPLNATMLWQRQFESGDGCPMSTIVLTDPLAADLSDDQRLSFSEEGKNIWWDFAPSECPR
jgi:hypothetical protein